MKGREGGWNKRELSDTPNSTGKKQTDKTTQGATCTALPEEKDDSEYRTLGHRKLFPGITT